MPAARFSDPRTMGEGKHARFTRRGRGACARGAVAFGVAKVDCDVPLDATFSLELNEYNGSVEPRLVLRDARPCAPAPIAVVGEPRGLPRRGARGARAPARELVPAPPAAPTSRRRLRDRRGGGIAGTIAALVASGEPVLVVAADAVLRARHLAPILGGFELCSHEALERDPPLARADAHVVLLDPPAGPLRAHGAITHLAWGPAELRFAEQIHERDYDLRAAAHRDVPRPARRRRRGGRASSRRCCAAIAQAPRPAALAGRVLRVLARARASSASTPAPAA